MLSGLPSLGRRRFLQYSISRAIVCLLLPNGVLGAADAVQPRDMRNNYLRLNSASTTLQNSNPH